MSRTLTVNVISDVICPWCYIGKRRLDKAITTLNGEADIQVRWHPFQLNPTMPKEGITRREYRTRKFGSWQRSQELDADVGAVGTAEGIRFDFERTERTPNTVDAHRVIWLAGCHSCQDAVVEVLFAAYFTDGLDIGNTETLIEVAASAGLNGQDVREMLKDDDGIEAMTTGKELSQQHIVTGVPFFIVNNEITLSGAQPSEIFLEILTLALKNG